MKKLSITLSTSTIAFFTCFHYIRCIDNRCFFKKSHSVNHYGRENWSRDSSIDCL